MSVLVIAEHDNSTLKGATLNTVAAAKQIGGDVVVLVAGSGCAAVADQAAKVDGVSKVLLADNPAYAQQLAENMGLLIAELGKGYSHILAPASSNGKSALPRAAALLDGMPHVHLEVGAILAELGRQPRAAREFFVKYQDRILFGKDSFQPDEFPYFWRVFETNDEYFDYYRDYHAFWKLYGMGLPDDVLKKLYYKNALRLIPGLPSTGWPQ